MRPRTRTRHAHRRRAFSLLEITLVLVIIGLLIAGAAVGLRGAGKRAKIRITKQRMAVIANFLDEYGMSENAYPVSLEQLVAAGYVEADDLADAWGSDLYYASPSVREERDFDLISNGPDREPNTADDIDYWGEEA